MYVYKHEGIRVFTLYHDQYNTRTHVHVDAVCEYMYKSYTCIYYFILCVHVHVG